MCGISGWFSFSKYRPRPEVLKNLLLANMERGRSATGMAWWDGKDINVRKGKGPASEFIAHTPDEVFQQAAASPRGLLHARATTKGSEDKNENNHPVVGLGWVAIHNGAFSNDDDLWGYYKATEGVERFAEVDTSVVNLMLSRGKTLEDSIFKMSATGGSATIAAWAEKDPDRVLLGRWGHNDLHMFYDPTKQILYWSSAASAAYVMPGVVAGRHKFLTMSRLADDHVLLLSPEGLDATRVFKVTRRPFVAVRKAAPPRAAAQPTYESQLPVRATTITSGPGSRSAQSARTSATPSSVVRYEAPMQAGGYLRLGEDFIEVDFHVPANQTVTVRWSQASKDHNKPKPIHDVLSRKWWNFSDVMHTMQQDKLQEWSRTTGYGTWFITKDKADNVERMVFKAQKRIKSWWDRVYRTRFEFPLTIAADGKTSLDYHMQWEHLDLTLRKSVTSSVKYLGWMCPWCGVWMSSSRVQEMRFRCEFCCIASRTEGQE